MNLYVLQESGDITLRMSECEELVGVNHTGDDVVGFNHYSFIIIHFQTFQWLL